jgi:hypothetical protein
MGRIKLLETVPALWDAVKFMFERREKMDNAASARISAALHARFGEITGRTLAGAPYQGGLV